MIGQILLQKKKDEGSEASHILIAFDNLPADFTFAGSVVNIFLRKTFQGALFNLLTKNAH